MGKAAKLLQKLVTGQFRELGSRAREELVRRQERRHYEQDGDYFEQQNWVKVFKPEFLKAHTQADGTIDLAAALRDKSLKVFFPGFERAAEFGDFIARFRPREQNRILTAARNVLDNEFTIFNNSRVKLGDPPVWNEEARTKKAAPEKFYGDIEYLNAEEAGDSKITWEPSRLQFVYDLGQAYTLTGEEKYAAHFFDLLNHWNRRNRDYHGINFCSALEFAFRANSVIWGVYFFRQSESLGLQAARDVYRLLHISARFMADHLSRYFSPNTHLLGEAYGLYLIGLLFPEFREAEKWRATGHKRLADEIHRQINGDGMHAELSTCYHAYAVEFILSFLILTEQSEGGAPTETRRVLRSMSEVLHHLQLPDGLWPHIGDEDGGRLYFLSRPVSHNFSPILEATQRYLGIKASQTDRSPESFWLTGNRETESAEKGPERYVLTVLQSSGIVVSRSQQMHSVFQAGPFGYRDCPHSHADHLHLDLSVNGESLLVDPGTLCYTGDLRLRNLLRGSQSHNGPRLIDREYYDSDDPFGWQVRPDSQVADCFASRHASVFTAEYRLRLHDGVESRFCRRVLHLNDHGWMVNDQVVTNRPHAVAWDFLTPGALEEHETFVAIVGRSNHLRIRCHPTLPKGVFAESPISNDYDSAGIGRALRFVSAPVTGITQNFTITAFPHLDRLIFGEEKSADFGRFQFSDGGFVAYIESRMSQETDGFFTDAAFGIISFYKSGETHALLCGVSKLILEGRTIFESEAELPFADIHLSGDLVKAAVPTGTKLKPLASMKYEKTELKPLLPVNHVRNLRN